MVLNFFKKKKKAASSKSKTKKVATKKYELKKHEFQEWQVNTKKVNHIEIIGDEFQLSKEYFDALERYIPIISACIWTWKKICNTEFNFEFEGGSVGERNKAKSIINNLERRINPIESVKGGGFNFLYNIWFEHFFKYGRFAGNMNIKKDLSGIESFIILNPYHIKFTKSLQTVVYINGQYYFLNPFTSYYYANNMDVSNPYGTSMLEATPSLVRINDDLLRDMANSSSNAGTPRLHFKVNQPEPLDNENVEEYETRVNKYFDDSVSGLSDIASDENFYTWKDLEIGIAGGSVGGAGFVWKTNRQIIDEEIITACHLYAWAVAKSFGSTKDYVQVQFDLLMTEADSIQKEASNFGEWIAKTELLLNGIKNVEPKGVFKRFRDPAIKDMAVAERFRIDNIVTKVKEGIIDPDVGARALGHPNWFDKKLIGTKKNEKKPKTRVDESEQPVDKDKGDTPEKSPDKK